jgi:hypothetical protein
LALALLVNNKTRLQRIVRDKQSSLFFWSVSDAEKKFNKVDASSRLILFKGSNSSMIDVGFLVTTMLSGRFSDFK